MSPPARLAGALRPPLFAAVAVGTAVWAALPAAAPVAAAPVVAGPLRPLRCTTMPTDPALEAPLYAQDEGAGGQPDGWWCQLPHATEVPAGFVQRFRAVAPLAGLYAVYSTEYGARPAGGTTSPTSAGGSDVVVAAEANSSVAPPEHLRYPSPPRGRTVRVADHVDGILAVHGRSISVTWRYPTSGVPEYLRAVATVTVSGTGVSEAAVLGVARHVEPD